MSTLLGPEGAAVSAAAFSERPGPCLARMRGAGFLFRPYLENCIVNAKHLYEVLCDVPSQVSKSTRWMPWHQEPMKDAGACDIPRGDGNQSVIRGFPNGGTRRPSWGVAPA